MKKTIKSTSRGNIDFGWLKGNYSFSFGNYYNPEHTRFGVLRVLNDDYIAPSQGFGTHPHDNMEIITLVLEGQLAHKDSAGHEHVSYANGIQVMSAGTGLTHSEFNNSDSTTTNSLQIWIFPDKKGHKPRYDQSTIDPGKIKNRFHLLVGPDGSEANLFIYQNAFLSLADIENNTLIYKKYLPENGIYIFVIEGETNIAGEKLERRDAITLIDEDNIQIASDHKAKILVIEVPLIEGDVK